MQDSDLLKRIEQLENQIESLQQQNKDRQKERDRLKKTISNLEKERKAEKKKVQQFIASVKEKLKLLQNKTSNPSEGYGGPSSITKEDSPSEDSPDNSPEPVKKKPVKKKPVKKKPVQQKKPSEYPPATKPAVNVDDIPIGGGGGGFDPFAGGSGGIDPFAGVNPFGDAPAPTTQELFSCDMCNKTFNAKALKVHKRICQKVFQTKRKVFKVEVVDKELQPKKGKKGKKGKGKKGKKGKGKKGKGGEKKKEEIPKWKRDRDQLRAAMKMSRKIMRAQARGEDITKIKFEATPQEYDDRVQCPYCERKFNQTAADRHIPKCKDMQHNKPKPGGKKKKGVESLCNKIYFIKSEYSQSNQIVRKISNFFFFPILSSICYFFRSKYYLLNFISSRVSS